MKRIKIAIMITIVCFVLLVSCSQNNSSIITTQMNDNDCTEERGDVEVEYLPLIADSVDDLLVKIHSIKQGSDTDHNNISVLNSIVVPNFDLDGFVLYKIEITETSFFYYFIPQNIEKSGALIDYERDIIITVRRSEYVDQEDPLGPLIAQMNIFPNEDGYLYDSQLREVTFQYENIWVSVRAPKDISDYQDIKALCKVKELPVE